MGKDIQKLTQNERYDLKRKQIKEEWNKTAKEITQEDIIKNYREVNAEQDYKIRMLEAENKRLQAQLDREIHINRKMKKALEVYADPFNDMQPINELAQQTLKQIEEME